MATETPSQNMPPKVWRVKSSFPQQRMIIYTDHLLVLSVNGYKDTLRRILFNRIERLYVNRGDRIYRNGAVGISLFFIVVDALITVLVAHATRSATSGWIVWVLVGFPLPLLIAWMVRAILNPPYRLFITRAGRTNEFKLTMSRAKFALFYSQLTAGIRQCQQSQAATDVPAQGAAAEGEAPAMPESPAEPSDTLPAATP